MDRNILKDFIYPLLLPITLAFIPIVMNKNARELEKMKFIEAITKDVYSSENMLQGMSYANLLKPILKDDELADSLISQFTNYFYSKANVAAQNGNTKEVENIKNTANEVGGNMEIVAQKINTEKLVTKTEQAKASEKKAIELLNDNKIEDAYIEFKKTESIYPSYHSAYEMKNDLKKSIEEIQKNPDNRNTIITEAKKRATEKYIPANQLNNLKNDN